MNDVTEIANNKIIWILASIAVLSVIVQATIFIWLAKKNARAMDVSKQDFRKALRVGAISSIGPAIGVFIALIGLMTSIGGPMSWSRLAMIGSASTELAAMSAATASMGVGGSTLGDANFTKEVLAITWWAMALNGCGWLIFSAMFTHKMEWIRNKIGGSDTTWLSLLSISATMGMFGYLTVGTVVRQTSIDKPALIAILAAAFATVICSKLAKKTPVIREYSLGVAILLGISIPLFIF